MSHSSKFNVTRDMFWMPSLQANLWRVTEDLVGLVQYYVRDNMSGRMISRLVQISACWVYESLEAQMFLAGLRRGQLSWVSAQILESWWIYPKLHRRSGLPYPPVKYVVWSNDSSLVTLMSKHSTLFCMVKSGLCRSLSWQRTRNLSTTTGGEVDISNLARTTEWILRPWSRMTCWEKRAILSS